MEIILGPSQKEVKKIHGGVSDCWKIVIDFSLLFLFVTLGPEEEGGTAAGEEQRGACRPLRFSERERGCDYDWQNRGNSEREGWQAQTQEQQSQRMSHRSSHSERSWEWGQLPVLLSQCLSSERWLQFSPLSFVWSLSVAFIVF